jgi:hypothetical protein
LSSPRWKPTSRRKRRPIYAASRTLAVLGERAFRFDEVSTRSHAYADDTHVGTRRYYFLGRHVHQLFRIDGNDRRPQPGRVGTRARLSRDSCEALPFLPLSSGTRNRICRSMAGSGKAARTPSDGSDGRQFSVRWEEVGR